MTLKHRFHIRGLWLLAVTVLAAGTAYAGPPASASTIDQQQNLMDTSIALAVGGGSDQKLAQVVTSGVAGLLTEVRLPIACDGVASLTLTINDAGQGPGQTSLAVSTFPGSLFPPGDPSHFQSLPLATPPFIPAETAFAVILSASGDCGLTPGPVGESYTRGKAYFDARPNPPGVWVCMCGFPNTADDLAFQTFVDPVCRVPDVVGQTRVAAEPELRRYGCAVGRVTTRYAMVPAGTVLEQHPPADTQLASGSTVDLVVSLGKPPCKVPKLKGKTLRNARAAIARANCRVGAIRTAPSAKALAGRIVAQLPAPGARRPYKTRVNLVIGRGRK